MNIPPVLFRCCILIHFKGQWHRNNKTMEYSKSCSFFDKRNAMKCDEDSCGNLHYDDFDIDPGTAKQSNSTDEVEQH